MHMFVSTNAAEYILFKKSKNKLTRSLILQYLTKTVYDVIIALYPGTVFINR